MTVTGARSAAGQGPASDASLSQGCAAGRSDAGFSLLEMMVVTTVIAIVSLSAVLGLRLAPGATPAAKVDEFARAVSYLQAEALFTTRAFALTFAADGWEVLEFAEAERNWARRGDGHLYTAGGWGDVAEPRLEIEGREVVLRTALPLLPEPDVFLLPTGEATPFTLSLSDDLGRSARCEIAVKGELTCRHGR